MGVLQDMVGASDTPNWGRIPAVAVTAAARLENGTVVLETNAGPLWLTLHDFGIRLRSGERTIGGYGLLDQEPAALTPALTDEEGRTVITGGGLVLTLEHAPLSFTLAHADGRPVQSSPTDGHFVRRFRLPPVARLDGGWFVSLDLASGEPVYGLGEKWGRLDHRGQLVRSRNEDALGVNGQWSYKNTPFAWSPEGWGLLVHTPSPVTHGVGYAPWSQRAYGLVVEDDHLDLFLFAGSDGAAILEQYTGLTGRAPVPPLWSLGVILSKAYYRTPEEVIAVATEVRAKGMPCDTITFDGRAWQDTDTRFAFEWDPKRFHDPAATLASLKAMDFKICAWEYPLVSVNNPLFDELAAKGWLLKDRRTGEAYRYKWDMEAFGPVLTPLPDSGLIDFTHPEAYAYWRDQHKGLFAIGVDMIKADFGEQVEPDIAGQQWRDRARPAQCLHPSVQPLRL
ncbi:MAG: glycoside hydrolase family 31 protein [Azospirillaceae bacterium]|nr:glycoside hydrolase family 31 protein [Azospirillaceae bacterium]